MFFTAVVASVFYSIVVTNLGLYKYYETAINHIPRTEIPEFGSNLNRLAINGLYFFLTAIYTIWLLQALKKSKSSVSDPRQITFKTIFKIGLPFLLIALITYPFSRDIYLYLHYGLMALKGINPYLVTVNAFDSGLNPLHNWISEEVTTAYGPVGIMIFMPASILINLSPIIGVYVFKALCLLCHIGNTYLIWRLLYTSQHCQILTFAYLVNPLILIEHVSDAHVDVFISLTLIAFIGFLYQKNYVLSILAALVGFLIKTLPLLCIPLAVCFLLGKRRYIDIFISFVLSLIIIAGFSITILPTVETWLSFVSPDLGGVANSIHHFLDILLIYIPVVSPSSRATIIANLSLATTLGFLAYYAWQCLRLWFNPAATERDVVLNFAWSIFGLILFARAWVMPWYITNLLCITVLCFDASLFVLTTLTYSLTIRLVFTEGAGRGLLSLITTLSRLLPSMYVLSLGHARSDLLMGKLLGNKVVDSSTWQQPIKEH
ncbi:MAG: hypothetical protein AAGF93_05920 [Cyanobacteria bacterium P01_H01_bin.105]